MNFLKPLCDKLRWFKPPLLGAGPIIPAGSWNHLTLNKLLWLILLVCAWSDGWMGLRLSVLCHESPPLPESVFLPFFLQTCVLIVRELHSQLFLLYLKSRSGKSIRHHITALRRSFLSHGGRWRGHSSTRPIGGFTVVTCYLEDTEILSGWMSQRTLTKIWIWKLPLTGWNPGSIILHGKTSHDFTTPGLTSTQNYFSLKHSVESDCSSVWFIGTTLRKLINPPNFWLKISK